MEKKKVFHNRPRLVRNRRNRHAVGFIVTRRILSFSFVFVSRARRFSGREIAKNPRMPKRDPNPAVFPSVRFHTAKIFRERFADKSLSITFAPPTTVRYANFFILVERTKRGATCVCVIGSLSLSLSLCLSLSLSTPRHKRQKRTNLRRYTPVRDSPI